MRRTLAALGVGIVVVLAGPGAPQAQEKSFTFPSVIIDATVLPDGSLDLVEQRTFQFSGGAFSVGTYGIDWPNELVESFGVQQGGEQLNTRDVSDGPEFAAEWDFPEFETGRQTFQISYRLRCAVTVYSNFAHLYQQFVGSSGGPADLVRVTVHLPGVATGRHERPSEDCPPPPAEPPPSVPSRPLERSEVHAKAFGPASGTFTLPDPQTVVFIARDVPADGFVEGTILFPPEAVPLAFQRSEEIDPAKIGREEFPGGRPGWFSDPHHRFVLALWLLLALPVFWILVAIGARLRDKVGIPDGITQPPEPGADPVDIAVLWGTVRGQTFSTTAYGTELLHLARTGVIDLQPVGTVSNPTDFRMKLVGEPQTDVDRDFVEFVFGKGAHGNVPGRPDAEVDLNDPVVSDDGRVSLSSLRRKGGSSRFKKWSNDLTARSKSRIGSVPKHQKRTARRVIGWSAVLGVLGGSALAISGGDPAGLPQVFFWEALLIATPVAFTVPPKLSPELRERALPWRAFRNYLKEFSSLPEAPALAVIIWEQYLEYATALGVAKQVAKQVGSLVPAEQLPAPWPGASTDFTSLALLNSLRSVSAIPPMSAVHNGSSSSSGISSFSSFGGSFSSGGGFGGGSTHVGAR
ncbi:MAG TPA: DUF2207 domain-containing protein [Actinomycetota bacterium]|nr:DUF2207 domain-containing protein [Actinomycetota bacterium]